MDLKQYKKQVKALGYCMRVASYSDFKACTYTKDGAIVPTGVMTRRDCDAYGALHELRAMVKGSVFDGYFRVVV